MWMIGESFRRFVLACCIWYFSVFRVCIWCCFSCRGNQFFSLGCFKQFLANFRQRYSLLSCKVDNSSNDKAWVYVLYLLPSIIFNAVFWTLSRSSVFSTVRPLCHTVAECSNWLLTKSMYICFKSSIGAPKLATLLRSYIRAFAFDKP